MNAKEVVRAAIMQREISQEELAKKLGYKHQSGISNALGSPYMRVATLQKILESLGYDIVVVDRGTGEILGAIEESQGKRTLTDETTNINK